jgi:glutamyl-tRNA synthetase
LGDAAELMAVARQAASSRRLITDEVHGDFTGGVDDMVLRRADGVHAYNLAVVVDDHDIGVDQVVRGDDLLASTPRQAYLYDLLGYRRPSYAHVPLVLNAQGQRLAKRDGPVTMREIGLPSREVLALLGSSLRLCDREEAVDIAILLERFDPSRLSRDPWVYG